MRQHVDTISARPAEAREPYAGCAAAARLPARRARLWQKGLLTDSQFEFQKQKLLNDRVNRTGNEKRPVDGARTAIVLVRVSK